MKHIGGIRVPLWLHRRYAQWIAQQLGCCAVEGGTGAHSSLRPARCWCTAEGCTPAG